MKRLNNFISRIGADKVIHFSIGGWAVSSISPFGSGAMVIAWITVITLSIIKEKMLDDRPDWMDVLAGTLGGMVSFLIYVPADVWALYKY